MRRLAKLLVGFVRDRACGEDARGRRTAVIVDADEYERVVEAAEDAVDRRELHAARADDDYVPWDDVKADLGLA